MQKTIEQIYNGEIYPAEQMIPENSTYREICRTNGELKELFKNNLFDSMKADFETIIQNHLDIASLEIKQTFVDGFRLGAKVVIDIMVEDK